MARRLIVFAVLLSFVAASLSAEVFRFSYTKGEKFRIVSQVHESVYVNGSFSHDADILNKIAVAVTDTRDDAGFHEADFEASDRSYGSRSTYEWSESYASQYWRDGRGVYTIDPKYFMPVVRNVPLFPEGDIGIGGTWAAQGMESHDFRASLGIRDPLQFPITVSYTYLKNDTRNGVACAVFSIDYEVFHEVMPPQGMTRISPTRVAGASHQKCWWDLAARRPVSYEESFDFFFSFTTGVEIEFRGDSTSDLIPSPPLDRSEVTDEIKQQLESQGVPDVSVQSTEQGVKITLEDVNFPPDSDQLLPAEQDKLRRIADILRKYPDRDIAVEGFTARAAGYTEDDYRSLSEQRAKAAADFLLSTGAVTAKRLTARGMGASLPIGDNSSEEGRRQNRRVEITILEN